MNVGVAALGDWKLSEYSIRTPPAHRDPNRGIDAEPAA